MSRALVIINGPADREKVARWAHGVPVGTRIEFKETKRSLPQNDRFWAMLTDIAAEMKKRGRDHAPDQWKVIFLAAYGHEVKFLPSLDQKTFIPLGHSSSDLSVKEMSDLMEFMTAWAAENNVPLRDNTNTDDADRPAASEEAEAGSIPASPASASSTETPWIVTAARMLWAATHRADATGDVETALDVLNNQRKAVGALMPEGTDQAIKDKAGSIYTRCKQVVMLEIDQHDAKAIIAGIAGITEEEMGA